MNNLIKALMCILVIFIGAALWSSVKVSKEKAINKAKLAQLVAEKEAIMQKYGTTSSRRRLIRHPQYEPIKIRKKETVIVSGNPPQIQLILENQKQIINN
jgi:ABC-type Fe3+-hydroxamate transport system substrate-binding protein